MAAPLSKKKCLGGLNDICFLSSSGDHRCLTSLPNELLVSILSYLSARDKLCVRSTCRRLHSLLSDSLFWTTISWRDYFPLKHEKSMKCALQLGKTSLTKLNIFSCGSIALSKFKSTLSTCTLLKSIVLIGFAVSQPQITSLLLSISLRNLEVEILGKESKQIVETLAPSQLVSVVLHVRQTPNITILTKVWSDAGYSPSDVTLRICHKSEIYLTIFQYTLVNLLDSLPQCSHKARLAVGYSSIHTYIRQATMQPFCEISNGKSGFEFSLLGCKELGLSTHSCMLALTRPNATSGSYSAACMHKSSLNQRISQDVGLIENITELCLANQMELSSHHLTHIAVNCPHLIRLNIHKCTSSLLDLSGLSSVVTHCHNLQGINLGHIHHQQVEDIVKLWGILAKLKHLTHLYFCYCLVCLGRAVPQGRSASFVAGSHPSRVSRLTPHSPDTEVLRGIIRKFTTIDALELACYRSVCIQDDTTAFKTLSYFKSIRHLRLEGSPHKVSALEELISPLQLSTLHITSSLESLKFPSNPAFYQTLQKISMIAPTSEVVISRDIASALTSRKQLTHIYMAATFNSPDAITILVHESPSLMECFLTGRIPHTRSSVKQLERSVNSELKQKKVRHKVVLYVRGVYPTDIVEDAIAFTELSSMW